MHGPHSLLSGGFAGTGWMVADSEVSRESVRRAQPNRPEVSGWRLTAADRPRVF